VQEFEHIQLPAPTEGVAQLSILVLEVFVLLPVDRLVCGHVDQRQVQLKHKEVNGKGGQLDELKDAMPVSFRSILFTSYILTIFKQQNLLP